MSYCRFNDESDVYVYSTKNPTFSQGKGYNDVWICCQCLLNNEIDVKYQSILEMLTHLNKHKELNHKVPEKAINRLNDELNFRRKKNEFYFYWINNKIEDYYIDDEKKY